MPVKSLPKSKKPSGSTNGAQKAVKLKSPPSQPLEHGKFVPFMQCGSLTFSEKAEIRVQRVAMIERNCCFETNIQRLAVLSYDQVARLNEVMNEVVSIQGRGNFPTIEVPLKDLVTVVRSKLEEDYCGSNTVLKVDDIRLNGGAASYVLDTEECSHVYNDLDLIFAVELSNGRHFDRVKTAVLNSLLDLLPEGVSRKRMSTCSLKEAYVSKMVKVNSEGDCWSLISLGNSRGNKNVELKFVDSMKRPFEFSVDSFQIILDSLLLFYECSELPISDSFYPTVIGESVYGDFQEAFHHLQKKLIATRNPEEIRGGGLLKYCHLLVRKYRPAFPDKIKTLERYMCSRFFIDFPDINQQKCKLENYLWNHFIGPEEESLKYQYLLLLRNVVNDSTVCLMGHERRQTLALIDDLAYQVLVYSGQQKYLHSPTALMYSNGYYYSPMITPCSCNSYVLPSNTRSSSMVRYPTASSPSSSSTKSSMSSSSSTLSSSPPSASSTPPPLPTA